MIAVGAQFGYSKTKRHPSTKNYIFATKGNTDIINIEKTADMLDRALKFIKTLGEEKKTILFVSGKPESKTIIEQAAKELNMPYVENRWIGGTLTNFGQIKKRIETLIDLKARRERGDLAKYTKKEQSDFTRQIEKMTKYFGGLIGMTRKPDAIVIIDTRKEHIALTESNMVNIPVIALVNTDCDIADIDFPIIANDASRGSVKFFVDKFVEAYKA
jgi:small subunit ribosomal protein S2